MKKNKAPEILTTKQLAEYLQMDEATVYRLARKRKIPAIKILGQWRFKKDVIDRWIENESTENIMKKGKL